MAAFPPKELLGHRDPALLQELEEGWKRVLQAGGIEYDPIHAERLRCGNLRFHFIPGRESRPNAGGSAAVHALRAPHVPCPFDLPETIAEREVIRFHRDDRTYHLIANRFPVAPMHFLLVRESGAPAETLPQCLLGPEEIEDALRLSRSLGPSIRFYFNSNASRDGSSSGSTVNHWHFQLFPLDTGAVVNLLRQPRRAVELDAVERGPLPGWDVPNRYHRGDDLGAVARSLWEDVERAIELGAAYNVEIVAADRDETVIAILYARAPLDVVEIPGIGTIPCRFGGWEVQGDVVIDDEAVFTWARENPKEAGELAWKRLAASVRDIWV